MENLNYKNIDTEIYIGKKVDSNKKIVLIKREGNRKKDINSNK